MGHAAVHSAAALLLFRLGNGQTPILQQQQKQQQILTPETSSPAKLLAQWERRIPLQTPLLVS
jgi:hypothetical protein